MIVNDNQIKEEGEAVAWLFSTLLNLIRDLIWGILVVVINSFNNSLLLSYDPDTLKWTDNINFFHAYFDTGQTNLLDSIYKDAIMPLAIGLLLWNLCYHLYISMFSKTSNDVDEPVPLVIRSGICMFLVMYATKILRVFLYVMGVAFHYLENAQKTSYVQTLTGNFNFVDNAASFSWPEYATQSTVLVGSVFAPAIFGTIEVVIIVVLLIRLIQMLLLYVERYLQFYLLLYFAPLGFSAGASNSTKTITTSYLRMFASSVLSLFLTSFGAYIYTFLMVKTIMWDTSDGTYLVGEFMLFGFTLAWYQWFLKLDTYLNSLGLTNVVKQAPLPMLNAMGGMFSMAAMGSALSSVAGAAKGAGAALMNQAKKGSGAGMATASQASAKAANAMASAGGVMRGQPAASAGNAVGQWMANHDPTVKALRNIANPGKAAADKANDMINAASVSGDVDKNTKMVGGMLKPQDYSKNGKPVNEANSSMAVMSNSGQQYNVAKDPATGNYYDKNTGATFGKKSYNANTATANPISGKLNNTAATAQTGISPAAKGELNKAVEENAAISPLGQKTGYSAINASNGKYQLESKYNPSTGNWDTKVLGGSKFNENTGKWEDDNKYSGADGPVFSSPEEAANVIGNNEQLKDMSADVYQGQPYQNTDEPTMCGSIDFGNSQYQFETKQNPDTGQMETSIVGGSILDENTGKWSPDDSFSAQTYQSPAEAAQAIAANKGIDGNECTITNDAPVVHDNGAGVADSIENHDANWYTAPIGASNINGNDGMAMNTALETHAIKNKGGVQTAYGSFRSGESAYQFESTYNNNTGSWDTTITGGSGYDSATDEWKEDTSMNGAVFHNPSDAVDKISQVTGQSDYMCDVYTAKPQELHSSDLAQSGGFYQALDDRNNISGGMYRSPIPAYTDMKVVQTGNGEIQVVTAGLDGKVVGTDLYHVDANEYKKNPSACYTIGDEHYKVASSSDSATRKASIYTVDNGKLKVKDMFSSTLGENNGNA